MSRLDSEKKINDQIKIAFGKNVRAMKLFPDNAKKTAVTKVRLLDGVKCEIEDGGWKVYTDFNEKRGGKNEAPNPGILGRGAFGTCLLMGYVMWAAKLNLDIKSIEMNIEADFDARGEFGFDNISPGYSEIRYEIIISSNEDFKKIKSLINKSEKHSSFYELFNKGTRIKKRITFNGEKLL